MLFRPRIYLRRPLRSPLCSSSTRGLGGCLRSSPKPVQVQVRVQVRVRAAEKKQRNSKQEEQSKQKQENIATSGSKGTHEAAPGLLDEQQTLQLMAPVVS